MKGVMQRFTNFVVIFNVKNIVKSLLQLTYLKYQSLSIDSL